MPAPARIPADFDEPGAAPALWHEALTRAGGEIDVLVNNAGVFEANPLDDPDWLAGWERTMRINLTASAELCRLAVLHWQERGVGGRIVVGLARTGAVHPDRDESRVRRAWHLRRPCGGELHGRRGLYRRG